MLANPRLEYKRMQVQTSTPVQLVIMAYEAAHKAAEMAAAAVERRDLKACEDSTRRAMTLITELSASLNYEAGQIANDLYLMYEYMEYRLIQANLKKDAKIFREVSGLLEEIKSAWEGIKK